VNWVQLSREKTVYLQSCASLLLGRFCRHFRAHRRSYDITAAMYVWYRYSNQPKHCRWYRSKWTECNFRVKRPFTYYVVPLCCSADSAAIFARIDTSRPLHQPYTCDIDTVINPNDVVGIGVSELSETFAWKDRLLTMLCLFVARQILQPFSRASTLLGHYSSRIRAISIQ